jgi:hypothetical protein
MIVGVFEFRIILATVQNSICIIAFINKLFCQRIHPVGVTPGKSVDGTNYNLNMLI